MSYALKMNLCPDLCLIMYPFKLDTFRSDKVSFLHRYLAELARASHSLLEETKNHKLVKDFDFTVTFHPHIVNGQA